MKRFYLCSLAAGRLSGTFIIEGEGGCAALGCVASTTVYPDPMLSGYPPRLRLAPESTAGATGSEAAQIHLPGTV